MTNELTNREEFQSNTITYPKKEAVVELRKRVKETCEYLDTKTVFDFDRTKNTDAYQRLNALLESNSLPKIGVDTLQKFFRSTDTFIKDGEEVFSFRRRILAILEYFVEHYGENINPVSNITVDNAIKSLLHQLYLKNEALSSVETKCVIDEKGITKLAINVFMKTLSEISNVRVHVFAKARIKVNWIKAYESMTKQRLTTYPYDVNDNSYYAYIIFPQILPANTNYYYEYIMEIEGAFDELIEKKEQIEDRHIVPNRYKSIIEEFHFPNTDFFKTISLQVFSHPDENLSKKQIEPIHQHDEIIFKLDFGNITDISVPLKLFFKIN